MSTTGSSSFSASFHLSSALFRSGGLHESSVIDGVKKAFAYLDMRDGTVAVVVVIVVLDDDKVEILSSAELQATLQPLLPLVHLLAEGEGEGEGDSDVVVDLVPVHVGEILLHLLGVGRFPDLGERASGQYRHEAATHPCSTSLSRWRRYLSLTCLKGARAALETILTS